MKIAAIFAIAQGLCPRKAYFARPAVGHVIRAAKQAANRRQEQEREQKRSRAISNNKFKGK